MFFLIVASSIYIKLYSLFVSPVITKEPLTDFPLILIGELGRIPGMFLVLF